MAEPAPAYKKAYLSGELSRRIKSAYAILQSCAICPRNCEIDRLSGKTGFCRTGKKALVASFAPHFGEEAPLVGTNGSGTIFFTHCSLMCNFCQNFDISHKGWGKAVSDNELAAIMLSLQAHGCHNINFVTPSHVVPQILSALLIAVKSGLHIPLVYNSSGYDRVETLKLLDGIVDIYMPDFKFWDTAIAEETCRAPEYPKTAQKAIGEMHRQVGDLVIDNSGIAKRGLIVRHLVMPDDLAGTRWVMRFIREKISPKTYVNIMSQYRPMGNSHKTKGLSRPVGVEEYRAAIQMAKEEGIVRLDRF